MVIDFTPLSSKGDIDRAAKRLCQVCNQPGLVVSI